MSEAFLRCKINGCVTTDLKRETCRGKVGLIFKTHEYGIGRFHDLMEGIWNTSSSVVQR